jgi:hypothetical protein
MKDRTHHRRTTWLDDRGNTWRVERIADRWQLSRWAPATETWQPIGSYPTRAAAIRAAYGGPDGEV